MEFNNNNSVIKLQMNPNSQVPINSTKPAITVAAASTETTPKAKMGSRRIFKTEFKVQVLDSYWNDNDCKGNQRATARKYGIHRRQIQKWLGNEKSLREQLKNQNSNNVVKPHQFHNVAYGGHKSVASITTTNSSAAKLLSLGQARHSVAPTSTTSLSPSSTTSSSSSLSPSAVGTTTTTAITPIRPIPHQHTPVTIVPPTHYTQQHYHHYHHHHSQLPHFMPPSTSLPTTSTTDEYSLMVAGNHHQQHNHHHQQQNHFNLHHHYHQQQQQQLQVMAPIDLSLQRKPEISEHQPPMKLSLKPINFNDISDYTPTKPSPSSPQPILAVDLTCRKRHSHCVEDECTPEKVQKIKEEDEEEVDVEVDDGIEVQVAKPVKLFKPYLLGEEEKQETEQQQDPIIWSHSLTPNNRQCSSRSTTDSGCYPFPSGSPIFPSSPSSLGAFSPAAACPKGSPVSVSGYESSSSTSTFGEYPATSATPYQYSLDFKVNQYPSARSDNHSHVQRWLDHDANLRQGIAY